MPFIAGDHVLVASLGKGIVREVRRGGGYLVEIKGRSLVVHEGQLSRVEARKRNRVAPLSAGPLTGAPAPSRSHASRSLDLHGKTTDEAVSALDEFLNDAMLAGYGQLRVIHGRSGGRVRAAVHAHLTKIASVGYHVDPRNPGVTIVTITDA